MSTTERKVPPVRPPRGTGGRVAPLKSKSTGNFKNQEFHSFSKSQTLKTTNTKDMYQKENVGKAYSENSVVVIDPEQVEFYNLAMNFAQMNEIDLSDVLTESLNIKHKSTRNLHNGKNTKQFSTMPIKMSAKNVSSMNAKDAPPKPLRNGDQHSALKKASSAPAVPSKGSETVKEEKSITGSFDDDLRKMREKLTVDIDTNFDIIEEQEETVEEEEKENEEGQLQQLASSPRLKSNNKVYDGEEDIKGEQEQEREQGQQQEQEQEVVEKISKSVSVSDLEAKKGPPPRPRNRPVMPSAYRSLRKQ